MEDVYAKVKEHEFKLEAERVKWIEDARAKGYEASGPLAHMIRTAIVRLATAIGA